MSEWVITCLSPTKACSLVLDHLSQKVLMCNFEGFWAGRYYNYQPVDNYNISLVASLILGDNI